MISRLVGGCIAIMVGATLIPSIGKAISTMPSIGESTLQECNPEEDYEKIKNPHIKHYTRMRDKLSLSRSLR